MRKLLLQMQISLDGFVATEDRDVGWAVANFGDPELRALQLEHLWEAGHHVMGRRAYDDMSPHWPTSREPYAEPMNTIPKIVFSSTLRDPAWEGTTVVAGDLATEIRRLKEQDGGPLLVHGGATFARELIRLDLVDEYRLLQHPIALGTGLRIFDAPVRLRTVATRTYAPGVVAWTLVAAEG